MRTKVVKTTGDHYWVVDESGQMHEVHAKGKMRMQGIRSTSPVVVGDWVQVQDGLITDIENRNNYIIRRASNLSKYSHILAANIDQVFLFVTLVWPETAIEFVDRFLVTAEAYRVPVILVFNKVDLYTPAEEARYAALRQIYEPLGYVCQRMSLTLGEGVRQLQDRLAGKVTLLAGNSGVGKSSLMNILDPNLAVRTGEVSQVHGKGMHTTTFTQMFPISDGYVIDTPGIKGFGVVDLQATDIAKCFPEMLRLADRCKFHNCTHTHEHGCAVIDAWQRGEIADSRYDSYVSILSDMDQSKYR